MGMVVEKFNKWYSPRTVRAENRMAMIANSRFYNDCVTRQAVVFDMYIGIFAEMMEDVESAIKDINGDLKGLTFNGFVRVISFMFSIK